MFELQTMAITPTFEYQLRKAEMELKKGQNMLDHEKEIFSRPARSWFQTGKEKAKAEGRYFINWWAIIDLSVQN